MLLIRGNITKICSRNNQSNSSEINLGKMWKAKLYRIYNATDNSVTTQHKHNKKKHAHTQKQNREQQKLLQTPGVASYDSKISNYVETEYIRFLIMKHCPTFV